jgi:hypothetical protein
MENIPSPAAEPESLAELHGQNARHLCSMFMGLAELGAEMVQIIAQRARDEAYAPVSAPTKLPELAAAYDMMMRSLRRTGLMIQRLTKPAPEKNPAGPGSDAGRTRAARRDPDAPESLERLSDAELEALEALEPAYDVEGRSLGDIIGMILQGFGVPALDDVDRYTHLTPKEIGELYAGGAAPGHNATGDRADGRAGADAMRPIGATGCRDP